MQWPTVLHELVSTEFDDVWLSVINRCRSHPHEASVQGLTRSRLGQTALHAACYRYPPLSAVRALLEAAPRSALLRNQDGETPLHIACDNASEDVQFLLLNTAPDAAGVQDNVGNSPLHLSAGAIVSLSLLRRLVLAAPAMVTTRNERGVTPFLLLSREYEYARTLEDIEQPDGPYANEWECCYIFLRAAYFGKADDGRRPMNVLHAAAEVHCPRSLIRLACRLFPAQSLSFDSKGQTPLAIAAAAPLFEDLNIDEVEQFYNEEEAVFDDGDESYNEEEMIPIDLSFRAEEDHETLANLGGLSLSVANSHSNEVLAEGLAAESASDEKDSGEPSAQKELSCDDSAKGNESVIDLLVNINPVAASIPNNEGRLPLALAAESGKAWDEGLQTIIRAAPRALETRDMKTRMYPFMIAAVEGNSSLATVYKLILVSPELIATGIPSSTSTEKSYE